MKKYLCGLISGMVIMFGLGAFAATQLTAVEAQFKILVNGEEYKGKPAVVIDNSTYLPLRALGEVMGEEVNWNSEKRQVEIGTMPEVTEVTAVPTITPTPVPKKDVGNVELKEVRLFLDGKEMFLDPVSHFYAGIANDKLIVSSYVMQSIGLLNGDSNGRGFVCTTNISKYVFYEHNKSNVYQIIDGNKITEVPLQNPSKFYQEYGWIYQASPLTDVFGIKFDLQDDILNVTTNKPTPTPRITPSGITTEPTEITINKNGEKTLSEDQKLLSYYQDGILMFNLETYKIFSSVQYINGTQLNSYIGNDNLGCRLTFERNSYKIEINFRWNDYLTSATITKTTYTSKGNKSNFKSYGYDSGVSATIKEYNGVKYIFLPSNVISYWFGKEFKLNNSILNIETKPHTDWVY